MKTKTGWVIGGAIIATLVAAGGWLVLTDAPAYQFLVRLYVDKRFLKHTLREWGVLAPVIFIGLQALQVIISPIPGEVTGILGGYLFGEWVGLFYSTIGLTLGSVAAFAVGRWIGVRYVQKLVSPDIWRKMGFIVEAAGAILCFVIFLIPGLPKDITCYLFGLSPMPFWVFAIISTLGRIPGTWVLSAQGAHTASGDYVEVVLLTAIVVAAAMPLYYYRNRLIAWFRGKARSLGGWRLIRPACETPMRWRRLWVAVALASLVPVPVAAQQVSRERLWSIPQDGIGRPDVTGPIGRFEKDASGGYNIYGKNGERVGVGKPRTDGSVDLYDMRGKRGLEISPERPRRK